MPPPIRCAQRGESVGSPPRSRTRTSAINKSDMSLGVRGMGVGYSTRVKVCMALLVFATLGPNLRKLPSSFSFLRAAPNTNDISRYEQRFSDVKHYLPRNQVVPYGDEFAAFPGECNAFILAQYALAPTVLDARGSECAPLTIDGRKSAEQSPIMLLNWHDPQDEPYLVRLFPSSYFQARNHTGLGDEGDPSKADQMVLIRDFGNGVQLYAREGK
jgi:hypothetical protein